MAKEFDSKQLIDLVGKAKTKALINIMQKIQAGESLTAHEQKKLDEFEAEFRAKEAGSGRRVLGSQKELAKYLGKSVRMISYYKNQGMPINPDNTYDLDAIDAWFEERDSKGVGKPHGEPVDEAGKKKHWDSFYREFRGKKEKVLYLQLKGELISKSVVEELLENRAVEFKRALMERGRRLSLRLANKPAEEIRKILDDDAVFILRAYSAAPELEKKMVINNEI